MCSRCWLVFSWVLFGLCRLILFFCCLRWVQLCISCVFMCFSCVSFICNLFLWVCVCWVKMLRISLVWLSMWYLNVCLRLCFWLGVKVWLKIISLMFLVLIRLCNFLILLLLIRYLVFGWWWEMLMNVIVFVLVECISFWNFCGFLCVLGFCFFRCIRIVCFLLFGCLKNKVDFC